MSELLSCPFCGGEAEKGRSWVGCISCGSTGAACVDDAKAIEAWNRRADPLVEKLRGALEPFARLGELLDQYQDYRAGRGLVPAEVTQFGDAFRRAREALALPDGGGSSVAESAASVASDLTASDTQRKSEWREPPRTAERRHAIELEAFAINQRPKTRDHSNVRLFQYEGTDLYQWYSQVGTSVFEDPFGEPFVIPSHPDPLTVPETSRQVDGGGP